MWWTCATRFFTPCLSPSPKQALTIAVTGTCQDRTKTNRCESVVTVTYVNRLIFECINLNINEAMNKLGYAYLCSLFEIVFSFIPGGSGEPVGVGRVGDAVDTVVVTIH